MIIEIIGHQMTTWPPLFWTLTLFLEQSRWYGLGQQYVHLKDPAMSVLSVADLLASGAELSE